jgi:Secretion system C-terminal sorting domain
MQNTDGTFFSVGWYDSIFYNGYGNDSMCAVLVKFDANFNILWMKRYDGNKHETFDGIKKIDENRFLLYGLTRSTSGITAGYGTLEWDILIFVVDSLGNVLHKTFYGYGGSEQLRDIEITTDGRILFVGMTGSHTGDFADNPKGPFVDGAYVACLDTALNKKWIYYINNNYPTSSAAINKCGLDNNNNLIISVACGDTLGDFQGIPIGTAVLMCIDSNRNILWKRYFPTSNESVYISDFICDSVNNILVTGNTYAKYGEPIIAKVANYGSSAIHSIETFTFLVLLDSNRNMMWKQNFGSFDTTYVNTISVIAYEPYLLKQNNAIWIVTRMQGQDYNFYGKTFGEGDMFILKLDTIGNLVDKLRFGSSRGDGYFNYATNSLYINATTGRPQLTFHSAGFIFEPRNELNCASKAPFEYKICEIATWPTAVNTLVPLNKPIWQIAPNPNNGNMEIVISPAFTGTLSVMDIAGKTIYTRQLNSTTKHFINLPSLANGEYIVQLQNKYTSDTKKIIINK